MAGVSRESLKAAIIFSPAVLYRQCDIALLHAEGVRFPRSPGLESREGLDDFGPVAVVFHRCRIGLGIGGHPAVGSHDSDAVRGRPAGFPGPASQLSRIGGIGQVRREKAGGFGKSLIVDLGVDLPYQRDGQEGEDKTQG
jgi:hypothetical protein